MNFFNFEKKKLLFIVSIVIFTMYGSMFFFIERLGVLFWPLSFLFLSQKSIYIFIVILGPIQILPLYILTVGRRKVASLYILTSIVIGIVYVVAIFVISSGLNTYFYFGYIIYVEIPLVLEFLLMRTQKN